MNDVFSDDFAYEVLASAQTDRSFDPDEYCNLQRLMDRLDDRMEMARQRKLGYEEFGRYFRGELKTFCGNQT